MKVAQDSGLVQEYLDGIGDIAFPTAEEEREFVRRWRDEGDVAARNELWIRHLPWAASLAAEYYRKYGHSVSTWTLSEAISAASLAMQDALRKFDPDKGRFTTFSRKPILQELFRDLIRSTTIRLPEWVWTLRAKKYNDPIIAITPGQRRCLEDADRTIICSLHPGYGSPGYDIPREDDPEVDESSEFVRQVADVLTELKPREREIVERYYGFGGRPCEKFPEIAASLGISTQRVQAINSRTLDKLREAILSRGLVN